MKVLKNLGTTTKGLLAMALLLTVNTLFANALEPNLIIQKYQEKSLLVHLNFPQESNFKITLKDEDRVLLWKENQRASKHFSKKINLVNLPDGTYFLEVEDEQMITVCEVAIEDNVLVVQDAQKERWFKPVLSQKEEQVLLNLFLPQPQSAEISILDSDYNLVYQESVGAAQKIERAFDFSKAQAGTYILQTRTHDRLFENRIKL